jgi:hypothetical protein
MTAMKTLRTLMATVGLLLALTVSAIAQTTLSSTTLAAAVTATATQITVASATGIEVDDLAAIVANGVVAEFVRVRAINGVFLTVSRAVDSRAIAHLTGMTVYHAPEAQWFANDPQIGTACTRTSEIYLPHVNRRSKFITECSSAGVWYRLDLPNNGSTNLITKRGTATLDGSNPTPVTTGLAGIVSCTLTSNRSAAPGDDPVAFTGTWAGGGTLNIYAWLHNGSDPTLTASSDSDDVVAWACEGT